MVSCTVFKRRSSHQSLLTLQSCVEDVDHGFDTIAGAIKRRDTI